MERLTKKNNDGKYYIDEADITEITQRLAAFENAYEDLLSSMMELPAKLEKLRAEGKEKTVTYREMVTQKLINNNIIMFFERNGIK